MRASTYVPPKGDITTCKYVMVGEQPGQKEVRFRQPFIGPAGRELKEDQRVAGILESECYYTNVIKDLDKPLHYYIKFGAGEPTLSQEGLQYIRTLEQELLDAPKDSVFIAIGNVALWALTQRKGITKWRGSVLDVNSRYVVPMIHPATVLPPKFQYLNKILIQYDLKKAREVYEGNFQFKHREIITRPTLTQSIEYLELCIQTGLNGGVIDYDIEISRETKHLTCISFSASQTQAISIPFVDHNGDYFTIDEELEIMKKIAELLENPDIRKRGQNIVFDAHFLLRRYGIKAVDLDDTMIAQQIIMPEFPKGLDFIASIWTDIPYYKAEGKEFMAKGGVYETFWNYNGMDSLTCAEAHPKQMERIRLMGNEQTYERQRRLIEPLAYMMEHGIRVDLKGITERYNKLGERIVKLEDKLNEIVGRPLNANSPKQLKDYFYKEKGLKPYKSKGKATTNELAMKRLARRGFDEALVILEIRRTKKERSTYFHPEKYDDDSRIRCSYNPVGTMFSRLSSSSNIFGTGNNLQNQPQSIMQFFLPDVGYVGYGFDLAQAENRIVAYVGRVDTMIEAFESGKDLHSLTGSLISGLPYDEVRQMDAEGVHCNLGGGDKTWRFWGKKANHGLNYDLGYKTFALYYEIPENDGKYIVNSYHRAYPGVRQGFHAHVKKQLSNGRMVENLMGRKTLFLNQWGDKLFKEAYSCIPQGTVGDVINERGLEYVYYDDITFSLVELLMQVHDDIKFQIPLSVPWLHHAEMLMAIKHQLEIPLKAHGIEFVIPADLSIYVNNFSKSDAVEIKGGDIQDVEWLANKLREIYAEKS